MLNSLLFQWTSECPAEGYNRSINTLYKWLLLQLQFLILHLNPRNHFFLLSSWLSIVIHWNTRYDSETQPWTHMQKCHFKLGWFGLRSPLISPRAKSIQWKWGGSKWKFDKSTGPKFQISLQITIGHKSKSLRCCTAGKILPALINSSTFKKNRNKQSVIITKNKYLLKHIARNL